MIGSSLRTGTTSRRSDLDGLRAVAVLLVATYHVWMNKVSGGVDVFLLLSGFFVGGSILRATVAGELELLPRTKRLVGRLLPPLVVVVAFTLAASAIILPLPSWTEVARQSLASVFYFENWHLAITGRDYAGPAGAVSPFQHIWSLAVQGQLFVMLLAVCGCLSWLLRRASLSDSTRRRRVATAVVALMTAVSFAYAAAASAADQSWAYFDTFARGWEFLAGALAALWIDRPSVEKSERSAPRAALTFAGWAGLLLILATGVVLDGGALFPGPATLIPVVGALLIIVFAGGASRALSWPPLARAGAYAYAFYLWHWPVLVLVVAWRDGREVGWLAGTAILIVSAILAALTKRFVEDAVVDAPGQDLHRRSGPVLRRPTSLATMLIAASIVVALPAAWLARVEVARSSLASDVLDLERHPGALASAYPGVFVWEPREGVIPALELASEDKTRNIADGCWAEGAAVVKCSYGDLTSERVMAVVGGSHTEQWIDALIAVGDEHGFRVDVMIKWACELFDGVDGVESLADANPSCEEWSANALAELEAQQPDAVFTTWTRPAADGVRREMVPPSYEKAWERLARVGIKTIALRDNPWWAYDPLWCVTENLHRPDECGAPADESLDEFPPEPGNSPSWGTDVLPLDLSDVICPDGWCPFVQGGRIVYRDQHHLTNTWALSTAPVIGERMLALLGW